MLWHKKWVRLKIYILKPKINSFLTYIVIYNPNNTADYSAKVLGHCDVEISCPSGLRIPQI